MTATDPEGTTVAWGETLPVELGAVAGVSLGVFVQRTGTLSRMPNALGDGRHAPILNIVGGRYILVSGGTDSDWGTQTRLYDLIAWSELQNPPTLPFAPESTVIAQPTEGDFQVLAINSSGAVWYDLTDADTDDASAPSPTAAGDYSWADVAGGVTITSSDPRTSYVVGGTRTTGAPTAAVLVVAAGGALSWATLTSPRLGANAAWVDPIGLVIEGGNVAATSDAGAPPGAEYLLLNGTTGVPLDYATDTTTGAGMTILGAPGATSSSVLLVGGANATAGGNTACVLTVPCGGSYPACTPCDSTRWQATLPTGLISTQVFGLDSSSVFVVGEDGDQAMHAYTLSATTVVEIPFRVPRNQARAMRLPFGTPGMSPIAVVGGDPDAGTNTGYIESFIPDVASFIP